MSSFVLAATNISSTNLTYAIPRGLQKDTAHSSMKDSMKLAKFCDVIFPMASPICFSVFKRLFHGSSLFLRFWSPRNLQSSCGQCITTILTSQTSTCIFVSGCASIIFSLLAFMKTSRRLHVTFLSIVMKKDHISMVETKPSSV